MVRAILDGRKTQTRRALKMPMLDAPPPLMLAQTIAQCPYGQPGDRLWVREAYFGNHFLHPHEPAEERELHYRADPLPDFEGEETEIRWRPSIHMPRWASRITLEVTGVRVERLQDISDADEEAEGHPGCPVCGGCGWINSGPDGGWQCDETGCGESQHWYRGLWEQINGSGSWNANPWVWVVEFERITP